MAPITYTLGWQSALGIFVGLVILFFFGFYRGIETYKRRPEVITNAVAKVRSTWLQAKAELIEDAIDVKAEWERVEAEVKREALEKLAALKAGLPVSVRNKLP